MRMNSLFEGCNSLADLTSKRRELVRMNIPEMEINKQFNSARAELQKSRVVSYKRIPKFTAQPAFPKVFVVMPIVAADKYENAIYIDQMGVTM